MKLEQETKTLFEERKEFELGKIRLCKCLSGIIVGMSLVLFILCTFILLVDLSVDTGIVFGILLILFVWCMVYFVKNFLRLSEEKKEIEKEIEESKIKYKGIF